jgi:hypothetical protein
MYPAPAPVRTRTGSRRSRGVAGAAGRERSVAGTVASVAVAARPAGSVSASADADPGSAVWIVRRRSAWSSVGRSRVQWPRSRLPTTAWAGLRSRAACPGPSTGVLVPAAPQEHTAPVASGQAALVEGARRPVRSRPRRCVLRRGGGGTGP